MLRPQGASAGIEQVALAFAADEAGTPLPTEFSAERGDAVVEDMMPILPGMLAPNSGPELLGRVCDAGTADEDVQ